MRSLPVKIGFTFLLIDALFWLFVLANCVVTPLDCHMHVFAEYVFFLPLSHWLSTGVVQLPKILPEAISIGVLGAVMHFLAGYVTGRLIDVFRNR